MHHFRKIIRNSRRIDLYRTRILLWSLFAVAALTGCDLSGNAEYEPTFGYSCTIVATNINDTGNDIYLRIDGEYEGVPLDHQYSGVFSVGETETVHVIYDQKLEYDVAAMTPGSYGAVIWSGHFEDGQTYTWDVSSEPEIHLPD